MLRATLVVDTGWFPPPFADDKLNISNVMVNDNTFVPLSGPATQTCNLPPASIQAARIVGSPLGPVTPTSVQPGDDTQFRVVGCMYIYNLATEPLGAGRYSIQAVIGGNPVTAPAIFNLN